MVPPISSSDQNRHNYGSIEEGKEISNKIENAKSFTSEEGSAGASVGNSLHSSIRRNSVMIQSSLRGSLHAIRQASTYAGTSMRDMVHESLSFGGQRCSVRDMGGTATVSTEAFNLAKNLVGCGMLALPSGVSSYGDSTGALIPGLFWSILMGVVFGYYFLLIGRTCGICYAATYRECWEETMGNAGSTLVSLINAVKPALANLAYSMILGDTLKSLFIAFGWESCTRWAAMLIVTVVALLPLCLLKNLNVLAPTSIIGTIGFTLTVVVMGYRYYDGSYEEDGQFAKDLPEHLQPSFGTTNEGWTSFKVLVLVCMLFEAFVAHYNAPRFFIELKDRSVPRFALVVALAFGFASIIYFLIMVYGFLTFGKNCDGYILNNYSNADPLANFCRICIAIAIVCTYPITFMGFRDGVLDLFEVPMSKHTTANLNIVSICLLVIITIIALLVSDLGLVNAVGGGTLATILVFIFPTLMFRKALQAEYECRDHGSFDYGSDNGQKNDLDDNIPTEKKVEIKFSMVLMWFGIVFGVIGVYIKCTE